VLVNANPVIYKERKKYFLSKNTVNDFHELPFSSVQFCSEEKPLCKTKPPKLLGWYGRY
jgi:hypothetical protein